MADEPLIDELLKDAHERMVKSAEAAQHEFATVRTGRASPALLDRVVVDYYGAMTPPELTEERRRELVKVVRNLAEEGRVAIRNVRRDTMHHLRELKTEGEASSDDEHRAEVELQKLTDGRVSDLDGMLKAKEKEILEV